MRHILLLTLLSTTSFAPVHACTRALFQSDDQTVIVGRSMDWNEDMRTNLWVFPRGIHRTGQSGINTPHWNARYGSVVASVYNLASVDGINEKGLVMNMLYLAESDYGHAQANHPPLSVSLWGQYALDQFATVNEAVNAMQAHPFYIKAPKLPNGEASQVHLALSDASGDSAIFEYIHGNLVIHHGKQYQVMTNSPIYSQQLALNEYWQSIGGTVFLPGTSRAADRFARASFYLQSIPKKIDPHYIQAVPGQAYTHQALASVLGVIRAVSVPLGISTPKQPNIASTIWRSVADATHRVYYFDSAMHPNTFWLPLENLDFTQGAPVMKLVLDQNETYAGDVTKNLVPSAPFVFLSDETLK